MTEIIAVFRSRSQAMDCNSRLRANGVPCTVINTPKEAKVGCGLSIKLPNNMLNRAKALIANARYSAFYGYYTMQNLYGRIYIARS